VAGLVPGAHEGKGLGNQFLDELTNADVIINVVDASGGTNEKGEPVDIGDHDPLGDIDFIEEEMDLWLAGIVENNWESVERKSRSPDFDIDDVLADMLSGFGASPKQIAIVLRDLEYPDDPIQWEDEHREALARDVRQRTKPIVVAANKIDIAPEENVERLLELDKPVIPTTAEGELALRRAAENGLAESTIPATKRSRSVMTSTTPSARRSRGSRTPWTSGAAPAFRRCSITRSTICSTTSPPTRSRTPRSGPMERQRPAGRVPLT